ncbi:hypothetical protein SO802_002745 [Lithocarpus litseifolius]|uniref:Uncharacterized protein n=1 Tax=Lithocarpus litseifolius TaxID=425828 RepID=A0AAW2E3F7_9ROSI
MLIGAIFQKLGAVGVATIIWNSIGLPIAVLCEKIRRVKDHLEAELVAALQGLHFAHEVGFRRPIPEGPANWQKTCFVPTKSDALVIGFRKWLNKCCDGQVDWRGKYRGVLPPTPREQLVDRYVSQLIGAVSSIWLLVLLTGLEGGTAWVDCRNHSSLGAVHMSSGYFEVTSSRKPDHEEGLDNSGGFKYAAFGNLHQGTGNPLTGFGFYEPYWLNGFANAFNVSHLVGGYQINLYYATFLTFKSSNSCYLYIYHYKQ